MSREKKKRGIVRRVLRWLCGLMVAAVLYSAVGCYLPFAQTPEPPDSKEIAASIEPMLHDVKTLDRAAILETSTGALDERIRLMVQAKDEIVITTYECHDGESTRDLLAVAGHMAEKGVRVRFLVDGIAGRTDIMANLYFRAAASLENVEMRFYNLVSPLTPWKHMGRMHDKYVIVDDLGYILGGRNMYDGFLGNYPTDRHLSQDREALVYNGGHGDSAGGGSSLFALRDYFEGMWDGEETSVFRPGALDRALRERVLADQEARFRRIRAEKPELFEPCDYGEMTMPTDGIWLLSNPTTIYAKTPVLFAQLCALMGTAKEGVILHTPYAVLNDYMRQSLQDVAGRIPLTLMVNAVENGANVVGSGDYLYHKGEVLSTGARVLEYAGGKSYHGKAVAIDGNISVIGSFNQDPRSAYVDTELMLVIRGEEVNARLREHLEALHADCRRVIDEKTAEVPEGLAIPPLSLGRKLALYAVGLLVQPARNLI